MYNRYHVSSDIAALSIAVL